MENGQVFIPKDARPQVDGTVEEVSRDISRKERVFERGEGRVQEVEDLHLSAEAVHVFVGALHQVALDCRHEGTAQLIENLLEYVQRIPGQERRLQERGA